MVRIPMAMRMRMRMKIRIRDESSNDDEDYNDDDEGDDDDDGDTDQGYASSVRECNWERFETARSAVEASSMYIYIYISAQGAEGPSPICTCSMQGHRYLLHFSTSSENVRPARTISTIICRML